MQIIYTEDKEDKILTVKKPVKLISCKFIRDFTKHSLDAGMKTTKCRSKRTL